MKASPFSKIAKHLLPVLVFTAIPVFGEAHADELSRIAQCESHNSQYDEKGTLLTNPISGAVGVFQIIKSIHKAPARKMGYNILTEQGNRAYAQWLYKKYGTGPWIASKRCWRVAAQ